MPVVSEDQFNQSPAGLVVVTPITGTDPGISAHIRVAPKEGGLTKMSLIMADQIRTISVRRLGRRMLEPCRRRRWPRSSTSCD